MRPSRVEGAWSGRVTSVASQSARSSAERVGPDLWSVRDLPPAGQEVAVDATTHLVTPTPKSLPREKFQAGTKTNLCSTLGTNIFTVNQLFRDH